MRITILSFLEMVLVLVKGKLVKKEVSVDRSPDFVKKLTLQRQGSLLKRTNEIDDKLLKSLKETAFRELGEWEALDKIEYTGNDAIEVELIIFSNANKKYRPTICSAEMIKGKLEVSAHAYTEFYSAEDSPEAILGDFYGLFPPTIADKDGNFIPQNYTNLEENKPLLK
jgi:hypothetical protein